MHRSLQLANVGLMSERAIVQLRITTQRLRYKTTVRMDIYFIPTRTTSNVIEFGVTYCPLHVRMAHVVPVSQIAGSTCDVSVCGYCSITSSVTIKMTGRQTAVHSTRSPVHHRRSHNTSLPLNRTPKDEDETRRRERCGYFHNCRHIGTIRWRLRRIWRLRWRLRRRLWRWLRWRLRQWLRRRLRWWWLRRWSWRALWTWLETCVSTYTLNFFQ